MNKNDHLSEIEQKVYQAVNAPVARREFVSQLRSQLVRKPEKRFSIFDIQIKPAWALGVAVLVALILVVSSPGVVRALEQLLGYVPGLGLVENVSGTRILAEPVSRTRNGVTLTLQEVIAGQDGVKLSYEAEGLPAGSMFDPEVNAGEEDAYCLGEDSYPSILLPDGTTLEPDSMGLGGKWAFDFSGYHAGHSYSSQIPGDIQEAEFILTCLSEQRREATVADWVLPFSLVPATGETVIGEEVIEAADTKAVDMGISLTLDKVVKEEDGYLLYTYLAFDEPAPAKINLAPASVYVMDSAGTKHLVSQIFDQGPWNVYDDNLPVVFKTAGIPADGDVTLVIDKVYGYYTIDKTKRFDTEVQDKMSFTFDAGPDPKVGQQWALGERFEYGGYGFEVVSATMVEFEGRKGYEFQFQSSDPELAMNADLVDRQNVNFWSSMPGMPGANFSITLLYEGEIPTSARITIEWISVLHEGSWEVTWSPVEE